MKNSKFQIPNSKNIPSSSAENSTERVPSRKRTRNLQPWTLKSIWSLVLGSWNFCAAAEPELLTEARRALAESIPQIAIRKIEALREDPKLGSEDRTAATLLLAEALLDAGRHAEALRTIEPLSSVENPAAHLLRAHILAARRRIFEGTLLR